MAAQPFKAISWQPNEAITRNKLNTMAGNDQWLLENSMRGHYQANNLRRNSGVKMAGGLALITARKGNQAAKAVRFNNFFSSGCRPVVTTGVVSGGQRRIIPTIDGLGKLQPDHRGFQVHVFVDADKNANRKIARNFYVSWHALGY